MTDEVMSDLVDANTIANRLNLTIDNVIHKIQSLNIQPKTYTMKGERKNVKTALYSWEEIKQQLQQQQEQKALQKIINTADKLSDKNDIKILGTAFANKLDEIPDDCDDETFDQMYNASMFLVGKMLARSERRLKISEERRLNTEREKQEIEKDRNELLCFKQEVNNIYIKKYKSKELRSKIITLIRKKAYENNMDYSTFTVNMYGKYDGIHNFPFRENYRGYLDTIQARGHLKEFYEMVLNS